VADLDGHEGHHRQQREGESGAESDQYPLGRGQGIVNWRPRRT
jgi:hypothetical protein